MSDYFNQGWFGKHPFIYDFASFFITPLRNHAARKMGDRPLKIIDIATGTGAHAIALAKQHHDVTGIDLDEMMLMKANRKILNGLNLRFEKGDGTSLRFKEEEFDAATISFAMHDVPFEIGVKILSEAKRVISKTGFILIVDYNNLLSPGSWILHTVARLYESPNYRPFVKRGLEAYMEASGLRIASRSTLLGAVQYSILHPVYP